MSLIIAPIVIPYAWNFSQCCHNVLELSEIPLLAEGTIEFVALLSFT